ncbi:MAG: hypothetical protein H6779_00850 [Candidatus Nomurabacteria bacterium]|nr:hypothetical protein [Candidatus Nomurabacteria bacterium]USN87978.1 MAG: hypothetical protein H6779_00850 [Candidatus Nomurabacteria bacterium]
MITDNNKIGDTQSPSDQSAVQGEVEQAFAEEVGTLVFQSALMKYLAITPEETSREFESFINLNVGAENFFEILCEKYPDFCELLDEEMKAFQSEVSSIL